MLDTLNETQLRALAHELADKLSEAATAMAWASVVIGDMPANCHFLKTLDEARALACKATKK